MSIADVKTTSLAIDELIAPTITPEGHPSLRDSVRRAGTRRRVSPTGRAAASRAPRGTWRGETFESFYIYVPFGASLRLSRSEWKSVSLKGQGAGHSWSGLAPGPAGTTRALVSPHPAGRRGPGVLVVRSKMPRSGGRLRGEQELTTVLEEEKPEPKKRRKMGTLQNLKTAMTARLRSKPRNEQQEYLDMWTLKRDRARWAQTKEQATEKLKGIEDGNYTLVVGKMGYISKKYAITVDQKIKDRDTEIILSSTWLGGLMSSMQFTGSILLIISGMLAIYLAFRVLSRGRKKKLAMTGK